MGGQALRRDIDTASGLHREAIIDSVGHPRIGATGNRREIVPRQVVVQPYGFIARAGRRQATGQLDVSGRQRDIPSGIQRRTGHVEHATGSNVQGTPATERAPCLRLPEALAAPGIRLRPFTRYRSPLRRAEVETLLFVGAADPHIILGIDDDSLVAQQM